MRILYLMPGAGAGGLISVLPTLLRRLHPRRVQAVVVATNPRPTLRLFRSEGIPCFSLPSGRRAPLEFLFRLIRQRRIQLIQSCDGASDGARAAARLGLPHVWSIGGTLRDTFTAPSSRALEKLPALIDRLSDAVVVPSRALADDQFSDLPTRKLHVIPWGVEPCPRIRPRRRGWLRKKLGVPAEAPLIALVGNFYPAKRHLDFLRAAAWIHRVKPSTRFLMVGDRVGSSASSRRRSVRYRARVRETVGRSKFRERILWARFPPGTWSEWMPEIDLLLSPSREGMSRALLEAASCGVPAVAADEGGSREVIQDGRSGLLVPYRNPRAMAEAACRLLEDPALARRLGRTARRRARGRFSAQRYARRFERLYLRILQRQKFPPALKSESLVKSRAGHPGKNLGTPLLKK